MSLSARQSVVVFVTLALAVSGTVGLAGATDASGTATQVATDESTTQAGTDQVSPRSTCAAQPPDDHADPASDVTGWENGTWYDASLQVDQSDGVNASEQAAIVARTMARVEAIRCIEFNQSVPISIVSRDDYREMQRSGNGTANTTAELRTFDNAKFEALFLINESADSIQVQRRNRGAAVLGFYSPSEGEIFLIAEGRESLRIEEQTLAHELVHAWQDQRFNLSSTELTPQVRDEVNARNAVVEGDARYVDQLYQERCTDGAWNGTCLVPTEQSGQAGSLANVGVYFLKFQPYSDGPPFVRLVRTVGGWDAVNDLYERPPRSTEQAIHVEKYRNDAPVSPNITDRTTENWTRVTPPNRPDYGSVGEAAVMSTFVYPYYHSGGQTGVLSPSDWLNFDEAGNVSAFDPYDYESNYSAGWDGDRIHVYRSETNGTNETAYVWRLAWDSPQDARQFVAGYQRVLRYWGGERVSPRTYWIADGGFADAFHVSVEGRNVTVVNAPTVDQLDEVRTSIGNRTSGG